ncbi:MAG TPA: choice-of-anchor D domain-containing protein [Candidatus Sulfotelmatobacter sp.]|nr:choice-of-anchor D domain-containing protein [Candidatus Sulfotelmatobacter sp.]
MRRLLMVCAVTAAILAGFGVDNRRNASAQGNPPSALSLAAPVPLAGCPIGPAYTFCNVPMGGAGAAQVFTLTASATVNSPAFSLVAAPGLASEFNAADFTIEGNTCPGVLMANQNCTVSVAFTPTASGLRQALLKASDAGMDTATIQIAGNATNLAFTPPPQPGACAPDNAFTFCPVAVGGMSASQQFTLSVGSAVTNLAVSLAAVPGLSTEFSAGDFTIQGNSCLAVQASDTTCTVTVAFTPTAAGTRAAALTATDAQGDAASVTLAGAPTSNLSLALQANSPPCLPWSALVFCTTPFGGSTATTNFVLTNNSANPVTGVSVSAGTVPANFTLQGTSCPSTLGAGANCIVSVFFTPLATSPNPVTTLLQGTLTATDTQGDIAALNLSGTADDFEVVAPNNGPTTLSVDAGTAATYNLQISPDTVFSGTVTFVCPSNLPTLTTCTINSGNAMNITSIDVTPNTPVPFSAVFQTTSRTPAPPKAWLPIFPGASRGRPWLPAGLAVLAMLAAFALREFVLRKQRGIRRFASASALFVVTLVLMGGCGGHGATGTTGTPVGKTIMNFQITAQGAGRGITLTLFVD